MKIEVLYHDGVKETVYSLYQAHGVKVFMEANGYECDVLVDGEKLDGLPKDVIHPDKYKELLRKRSKTKV